jgi:hypothetical protein
MKTAINNAGKTCTDRENEIESRLNNGGILIKTACFLLVCCFCLTSCHHQTKNNEIKNMEKSDLKISLLFYPSMSIEDIRYSVDIINDSLIAKDHYYIHMVIGAEDKEYKVKLTNNQCMEIKRLTSALTQKYDRSDNWALDVWGCTLKVDNQVYYEDNFFSFIPYSNKAMGWQAPPEEIKLLIDYIVSLSPIPIELYGFA